MEEKKIYWLVRDDDFYLDPMNQLMYGNPINKQICEIYSHLVKNGIKKRNVLFGNENKLVENKNNKKNNKKNKKKINKKKFLNH